MRFTDSARAWVRSTLVAGLLLLALPIANAATVAYWRFEAGPADMAVEHLSGIDGSWSPDVPDSSGNGNALSVWNSGGAGFFYRADVPAATIPQTGETDSFSVQNQGCCPGAWNNTLETWTPAQWTIEVAFKPENGGYRTLVGRDSRAAGRTGVDPNLAALYVQIQPDNSVAAKFMDPAGYWHEAISAAGAVEGFNFSSDPTGANGKWYAMAAVSDGAKLSVYLNNLTAGTGYQLVAQTDLTTSGSTNTALTPGIGSGGDWKAGDFTVGRGIYNGGHGDRAYGFIDEVRLSDTALPPNQLLFSSPSQTEIKGTVTDQFTGKPLAGATVTIGPAKSITDNTGKFSQFGTPGSSVPISVTAPYAEGSYSSTISFPTAGSVTRDVSLPIRPHIALTTANGFAWKILGNTGGTADYSAVTADESAWQASTVPGRFDEVYPEDDIYVWYRVHVPASALPANFSTQFPNRAVILRVSGALPIDDVDQTYVNGTLIGETGRMPNPPLGAQPAGHKNQPDDLTPQNMAPGLRVNYRQERVYAFPKSLLNTTPGADNVIAIKVYDFVSGGGVSGTPTLEVAPATGSVVGRVTAGGAGVSGVRVAASDASGVTSRWAVTDSNGAYTLAYVPVGTVVVGAARPGYTTDERTVAVSENSPVPANLQFAAATGGLAPLYDDFLDGPDGWTAKWDALSEANNTPENAPTIYEPGFSVTELTEIPSTVTIEARAGERAGLLTKSRFSRFASVNSARLVSALSSTPEPGSGSAPGGIPNVLLQLITPPSDDPTTVNFTNYVEYDLEGYLLDNGQQRVQLRVFGYNYGDAGAVPVPIDLQRLGDVTPANPLELTVTRVGSYFDFYVNGVQAYDINLPNSLTGDHKVFLYSFPAQAQTTWDWLRVTAGATNLPPPLAKAAQALRVAGGLESAGASFAALNVVNTGASANRVDVLDVVALARQGL